MNKSPIRNKQKLGGGRKKWKGNKLNEQNPRHF